MVDQPEAGGNELFYVHPRFLAGQTFMEEQTYPATVNRRTERLAEEIPAGK